MPDSDMARILDELQQRLADFHRAVAQAHERAAARTLGQAARELRWLALLAHETAEDAWLRELAALQEAGEAEAAKTCTPARLGLAHLVERMRTYWEPPNFSEAAADLLTRRGGAVEDLPALARALTAFWEELTRAVEGTGGRLTSEAGGERG